MDEVADTTELFLRAQQLVRFCEIMPRARMRRSSTLARPESSGEVKIGEHVRRTMAHLANAHKLTPEVLADLVDRSYCKTTFGLNHAFLKKVIPNASLYAQRADESGYNRFWRDPLKVDGVPFLMCSQWFAWQRPAFDRWAEELG
jgi:hypothetical protein